MSRSTPLYLTHLPNLTYKDIPRILEPTWMQLLDQCGVSIVEMENHYGWKATVRSSEVTFPFANEINHRVGTCVETDIDVGETSIIFNQKIVQLGKTFVYHKCVLVFMAKGKSQRIPNEISQLLK